MGFDQASKWVIECVEGQICVAIATIRRLIGGDCTPLGNYGVILTPMRPGAAVKCKIPKDCLRVHVLSIMEADLLSPSPLLITGVATPIAQDVACY